jgi:hypothetical protein
VADEIRRWVMYRVALKFPVAKNEEGGNIHNIKVDEMIRAW